MNIDCTKELVRSYKWSDYNEDRNFVTEEIINGRTYLKTGRYCSTAFVGEVWKVRTSSDEPFKYLMLVGMSRQHPNEAMGSRAAGIEIAAENAFINPIMKFEMIEYPDYDDFVKIIEGYMGTVPAQYIRTKAEREILEDSKNICCHIGCGG